MYAKEFKCEAVRLLEATDKTGSEISRELDIKRNQLCFVFRLTKPINGEFLT